MLPYLKPFRTVDENLDVLERRGMSFRDREYARRCLLRVGYYRMSAYWYPFRDFCPLPPDNASFVRCDRFREGASFDDALTFYLFDKSLRLMLSDALERIEVGLRAAIVEVLGALGPHAHRDPRSYKTSFSEPDEEGKIPLEAFLEGQDYEFCRSKEEYAKHFRRSYGGHPPIWIAAGTWSWGTLTHTIAGLSDRNKIAINKLLDPDLPMKTMASWVTCLNDVRNACAHHSRLWNKPLINSPGFPKREVIPDLDHVRLPRGGVSERQTKRLYGALIVIVHLMKRLHPRTEWHMRVAAHIQNAQLPPEVGLDSAGFPEGWRDQRLWATTVSG